MDTQTICSLFFKIGGIKTKGNINFGYPLYTDCFFNFEYIKCFFSPVLPIWFRILCNSHLHSYQYLAKQEGLKFTFKILMAPIKCDIL